MTFWPRLPHLLAICMLFLAALPVGVHAGPAVPGQAAAVAAPSSGIVAVQGAFTSAYTSSSWDRALACRGAVLEANRRVQNDSRCQRSHSVSACACDRASERARWTCMVRLRCG